MQSQYLNQYGLKASFFYTLCQDANGTKMADLATSGKLKSDGMDIESHTMTHANLTDLLALPASLTYEIGFAKQCLANHGFNTPIFAYPLNLGSDNPTIVNLVAKDYSFAKSGGAPLHVLEL